MNGISRLFNLSCLIFLHFIPFLNVYCISLRFIAFPFRMVDFPSIQPLKAFDAAAAGHPAAALTQLPPLCQGDEREGRGKGSGGYHDT